MKLEGTIKRYIGNSSELKPFVGQVITADDGSRYTLTTQDLPAGSSFLETDTGRIYRFTGTGWAVFEPIDENGVLLSAILQELVNMRKIQEIAFNVEAEELDPA